MAKNCVLGILYRRVVCGVVDKTRKSKKSSLSLSVGKAHTACVRLLEKIHDKFYCTSNANAGIAPLRCFVCALCAAIK